MGTVALSGDDTIIINDRVLKDFGDGDIGTIEFPNEIANVKTGKNQNSIYSYNATGRQANVNIRVLRGSSDDKFFMNLLNQQNNNFASTVLMNGEFVKNIGDGEGNVSSDTYICGGGVFTKTPGAKSNAEGDSEQSIVVYEMMFANAPRTLT